MSLVAGVALLAIFWCFLSIGIRFMGWIGEGIAEVRKDDIREKLKEYQKKGR